MKFRAALIAAMFPGYLLPIHGQERKDAANPAAYKVEFDVRDGKDGPSRHFSMRIDESRKGVFQAASRIPVVGGSPAYIDVGVNIECTILTSAGKAGLHGGIEVTTIDGHVNSSAVSEPIIGQRKLAFDATVELGTPTRIIDERSASGAATQQAGRRSRN